jgi:hypothetical protein
MNEKTVIDTTETDALPDGYRRIRIVETLVRVAYVAVKTTGDDSDDCALVMESDVSGQALRTAELEPDSLFVFDADEDTEIGGGDY